ARDLRRVVGVLEAEESRMYSSSLLFVFEGDGHALRTAIESGNKIFEAVAAGQDGEKINFSRTNARIDSGIGMEDDEDDDEEDEGPKAYALRLIDFAHAKWTPGEGPDENVLL